MTKDTVEVSKPQYFAHLPEKEGEDGNTGTISFSSVGQIAVSWAYPFLSLDGASTTTWQPLIFKELRIILL